MTAPRPYYWDTSAILSALLTDVHSAQARTWLAAEGVHLASSLAEAELYAVLARLFRDGHLARHVADEAIAAFLSGPWRRVLVGPDPDVLRPLSAKWPLRGADLWHLAMAVTLQVELPDLHVLTFDDALRDSVLGENLAS